MLVSETKIFIKSNTTELENMLLSIVENNKFNYTVRIYSSNKLKDLELVKPDFIVIDSVEVDDTKKCIEEIKSRFKYLKDKIVVSISKDNRDELAEIIDLGISEFLFKPYKFNEVFLRFRNFMNYVSALKISRNKEIQFNALLNNTPYMAWFKDKDSNYIMVNEDFKVHSGKTMNDIYGKDDKYVWDGKIGDKCREYDLEVMEKRKGIVFDQIIPGKKGFREFNIHKAPVVDELDNILGTIGVARDITEIKNKDNQLRIIIENMPFIVVLKDIHGVILEVSSNILKLYNLSREELVGTTSEHLVSTIIPKKFFELEDIENKEVIEKKKSLEFQREIVWKNKKYVIKVYKSPIIDIEGKVSAIVTLFKDVTEEIGVQEKITKLAFTDALTGMGNRRALYKYLDKNIRESIDMTIGFIDLDNFKKLNDIYGHNYGDKILKRFSSKLSKVCKESLIVRLGGDEFVVVWSKIIESKDLMAKVDNILSEVKEIFKKYDKTKLLSASIGIVVENGRGNTIEGLMAKGDFALYKAKELGKNQYVFYTEELKKENMFNVEIESDLANAINRGEVVLNYQPQYSSHKELKGFEALFRWKNEKYKDIPINRIIRVIENSNMMIPIGECILEKSFIFANKVNKKSDKTITISVNISPIQIMSDNFVERVKFIMNKTNVSPKSIVFEITESVLLDDISKNIEKLNQIRDLGISIALDDFGTGYSSLNYLVKLPINEVKIDRSFVMGIRSSDKYTNIIKHITEIAHTLSLSVVAEGVEENWELDIIKDIGIDYIQGYLFGKPMTEQESMKIVPNN